MVELPEPGYVPNEGQCLLVDYKDCTSSTNVRDHYYGHAAYTRTNAMLFNFTQIIGRLYSLGLGASQRPPPNVFLHDSSRHPSTNTHLASKQNGVRQHEVGGLDGYFDCRHYRPCQRC